MRSDCLALQIVDIKKSWALSRELCLKVDRVTSVLNESPSRSPHHGSFVAHDKRQQNECADFYPTKIPEPSFFCLVFSDLDLSLSPTGKVVKTVGDTLALKMEKVAPGDVKVLWTKVTLPGLGLWSERSGIKA